jgi:hypothetical protein
MLGNLGDYHGQHGKINWYCPSCKVFGYRTAHIEGCIGKKVQISATARVPRKNASKEVWDKFYNKFVLQEDIKEFLSKHKKESQEMKTWRIKRKLKKYNK